VRASPAREVKLVFRFVSSPAVPIPALATVPLPVAFNMAPLGSPPLLLCEFYLFKFHPFFLSFHPANIINLVHL